MLEVQQSLSLITQIEKELEQKNKMEQFEIFCKEKFGCEVTTLLSKKDNRNILCQISANLSNLPGNTGSASNSKMEPLPRSIMPAPT